MNTTYHPTLTAAFNQPRWAKLELTPKQVHDVGTRINFVFSKGEGGRPVASLYNEYKHQGDFMRLEVFKIPVNFDGSCSYEIRLGVDLPDFLGEVLGGSVITTDGETILL